MSQEETIASRVWAFNTGPESSVRSNSEGPCACSTHSVSGNALSASTSIKNCREERPLCCGSPGLHHRVLSRPSGLVPGNQWFFPLAELGLRVCKLKAMSVVSDYFKSK